VESGFGNELMGQAKPIFDGWWAVDCPVRGQPRELHASVQVLA